ncbi:MAG TPA: hypothetical protein PLL64_07895, partial [Rhodothermales bacterium]|nr:hypothetical protein [Rhodothermales bacterium]
LLLLFAACRGVKAQDKPLSYPEILDQTDAAFQKANWKEVVHICEKAIAEGNDAFVIRQYLGIAYYRQKQYTQALPHFRKALAYFGSESITQEYLYFTLLSLGRNLEANAVAKEMELEEQTRLGLRPNRKWTFIYLEPGAKLSTLEGLKPMILTTFGIGHRLGQAMETYHAGNYIAQENNGFRYQQYQYYLLNQGLIMPNQTIETALHLVGMDGKNNAFGMEQRGIALYGGWRWTPAKWEITPQLTWTNLRTTLQTNTGTRFKDSTATTTQLGLALGYWPRIGKGRIWLGWQNELAFHKYETLLEDNSQTFFLMKARIWAQIHPKLNLTTFYYAGRVPLAAEDKGSLFLNAPDLTTKKWGLMAEFPLTAKISLYGVYQQEVKEKSNTPYQNHVIITGIKIKP